MMAELWGSIVVSVLFWGLANSLMTVNEAKRPNATIRYSVSVQILRLFLVASKYFLQSKSIYYEAFLFYNSIHFQYHLLLTMPRLNLITLH